MIAMSVDFAEPVGIKSFSITRLKHAGTATDSIQLSLSWNQKFLDYEIET